MRQWLSSFRKSGISEWKEPAGRLNGPRSEGGALVEARVFLTLASFSQGCHCTCLTGDTCKMERCKCVWTGGVPHQEPASFTDKKND